jgi:hypothetical protein
MVASPVRPPPPVGPPPSPPSGRPLPPAAPLPLPVLPLLACLCLAPMCRVYVQNRHLELMQLRALSNIPAPFDVAFFVAQRLRELKLDDKAMRVEGGASA